MPASAFESNPRELCVSIALSVSSSLKSPFRPSTPLDSHTFKIHSRKLRRITYFQKIAQLYQNKALQTPQNHTLSQCCFITPLESHTFKKEGMGGGECLPRDRPQVAPLLCMPPTRGVEFPLRHHSPVSPLPPPTTGHGQPSWPTRRHAHGLRSPRLLATLSAPRRNIP